MTMLDVIADALARVVYSIEALEYGDYTLAASVLRDLEADLAATLDRARSEAVT